MIDHGPRRLLDGLHARHRAPWVRDFTRHGGSGGGKTTVTNQIPAKTPEEIELIKKQNSILDIQIQELRRQNDALSAIFPDQQRLLQAQTSAAITFADVQKEQLELTRELTPLAVAAQKEQLELTRETTPLVRRQLALQTQLTEQAIKELEGTPEEQEIRKLSGQRTLAILRGEAPPLLPGQQERINTIFGAAREEATTELTRFGEDIATSRGLRVSDSPIGNELARQKRFLEQNLAAGKAGAELNVGQAQMQFDEAVRQFQTNLQQQAFQNRLALTGRPPQSVSPFAGGGGGGGTMSPVFSGTSTNAALAGAQGLLGQLSADRLGQSSQTSRAFPDTSFNYGRAAIGGASGALSGAATGAALGSAAPGWGTAVGAGVGALVGWFGGGYYGSSATLKKDILPLDVDEYEKARRTVATLPVARWRYKHEPPTRLPHIGVIAELSPPEIREGPLHISAMDLAGLTLAAVKGVDRRVDRMEARLPVPSTRGMRLPIPARAA